MKSLKRDKAEIEIDKIFILILGIVVAAILTGTSGLTGTSLIANATSAGQYGNGTGSGVGTLYNAPVAVTGTWNSVSVLYALAFLIVPVAAIVKYMK